MRREGRAEANRSERLEPGGGRPGTRGGNGEETTKFEMEEDEDKFTQRSGGKG